MAGCELADLRAMVRSQGVEGVIVALARLFGAPIPWPKPLRPEQAIIAVRSVVKLVVTHGACLVRTTVGA